MAYNSKYEKYWNNFKSNLEDFIGLDNLPYIQNGKDRVNPDNWQYFILRYPNNKDIRFHIEKNDINIFLNLKDVNQLNSLISNYKESCITAFKNVYDGPIEFYANITKNLSDK